MKTMKFLARRVSALVLVVTVGLTALVPAAFAAPASLPDLQIGRASCRERV